MTGLADRIHASATIEGDVTLGEGVVIGPNCIIDGTVGAIHIGDNCRLVGNCYITGPLTMGEGNVVWTAVSLGTPPQDIKFDPKTPGPGVVIGTRNTFRESVSVHRGKTDLPTRIGDDNYFMTCSHVGHDSVVGNHVQMASGALLAGHVTVFDHVIMGGNASVHQFCRVGRGAFFRGLAGSSVDVLPWCIAVDINRVAGLNLVGMRRSGMPRDEINRRRSIYRTIFRSGLSMPTVIERLRGEGDEIGREYADFIESAARGIGQTRDGGRAKRA